MIQYPRPPEPPMFADHCRPFSDAIKDILDEPRDPGSKEFGDPWGSFKPEFVKAQHQKCGYCEVYAITHDGPVEHYAPKAELRRLRDKGIEKPNSTNVRGRTSELLSKRGYHWRAYEWSNYLYACNICNKWKKNFFPVNDDEARTIPPDHANPEMPLLLNPFDDDPQPHLRFDDLGAISPKNNSLRGQATIEVCGLDRPSLTIARQPVCTNAYKLSSRFLDALAAQPTPDAGKLKEVAGDLVDQGAPQQQFAGVLRSIVTDRTQMSWDMIEQLAGTINP